MPDMKAMGLMAPKSLYNFEDIPDLSGKVVIVTGANTGIGKVTARELLKKNARVYAACRTEEKARSAIDEIKAATGKSDIHFLKLDLGDIVQANAAAEEFLRKEKKLDILINSAGVGWPKPGSEQAQGIELQWGTNVVGHYAFSRPLVPLMIETAKDLPPASVRMVWVSSVAHTYLAPKGDIPYDILKDKKHSQTDNNHTYGWSKLGDIHLALSFADELEKYGILSVSLNPGLIQSDLYRSESNPSSGCVTRFVNKLIMSDCEAGAITQLYAATAPSLTMKDTRSYFVPWARKYDTQHDKARDPTAIAATVNFCERETEAALRR